MLLLPLIVDVIVLNVVDAVAVLVPQETLGDAQFG